MVGFTFLNAAQERDRLSPFYIALSLSIYRLKYQF